MAPPLVICSIAHTPNVPTRAHHQRQAAATKSVARDTAEHNERNAHRFIHQRV